MEKYIYRGENEKEFYKAFIHNVRCDYFKEPTDNNKDYDTCWMAERNYYLGWKVVVAPVAMQFIRGMNS